MSPGPLPSTRSTRVEHEIETPDGPMPAWLWLPAEPADEAPGLVVLQEIFGLSDYIEQRCTDLAALGYAVLAPQIYWRLGERAVDESADDYLQQGMALTGRLDWAAAVRDGAAAVEEMRLLPRVGDVGIVGFCFGGGLGFAVAAELEQPPAVLVSYYGSALPKLTGLADRVDVPSLHHFGTADAFIPAEQVAAVRDAVTAGGTRPQVEFELHEGAGHAFDNPNPMFHHAEASARAWEQTVAFLDRTLPPN